MMDCMHGEDAVTQAGNIATCAGKRKQQEEARRDASEATRQVSTRNGHGEDENRQETHSPPKGQPQRSTSSEVQGHGDADGGGDKQASAAAPASLSLAAMCSKTVTTAPLNVAELENLPQHMLVQLLGQVVAERDAVQAKFEKVMKNSYIIDPPFRQKRVDRKAWTERVEAARKKWTPRTEKAGWTAKASYNGNINTDRVLHYNVSEKRLTFDSDRPRMTQELMAHFAAGGSDDILPVYKSVFEIISSALLLYRLCCIFRHMFVDVDGWEGYRRVWSVELVHNATKEAMGFSEWKAGALLRVSNLQGTAEFEADMLELLNVLCDPECPHPYDGVVAGSGT